MGLSFNMPDIVWKISFAYNSQKRHMRLQDAILVKVNGSMHCNGLWGIFSSSSDFNMGYSWDNHRTGGNEWVEIFFYYFFYFNCCLVVDWHWHCKRKVSERLNKTPLTLNNRGNPDWMAWHQWKSQRIAVLPACLVYIPLNLKHKRASDEAKNLDFSEMSRRPGTGGRPKSAGPGPGQQTTSVYILNKKNLNK